MIKLSDTQRAIIAMPEKALCDKINGTSADALLPKPFDVSHLETIVAGLLKADFS